MLENTKDPFNKNDHASERKIMEWRTDVFLFCDEMLNMRPAEPLDELKGKTIKYKDVYGELKEVVLFREDGRLVHHDLSFYSKDMFKYQERDEFRKHCVNQFTWQQTLELEAYDRGINTFDKDSYDPRARRITIRSGHGIGKCHGYDTDILMIDGTIKKVQNIVVGDNLMGDDNTPRKVLSLARGKEQMYRIKYKDKTYYDVNESHILSLVATQTHGKQKTGDITNIEVRDYLKWSNRKKRTNVGYKTSIELSEKQLLVDPYLFGLWLGDGCSSSGYIFNIDNEIKEYLRGVGIGKERIDPRTNCWQATVLGLKEQLRNIGVLNNKHIPNRYLISSKHQRLELLAGLIDTDGSLDKSKRQFDFIQKNKILAKQTKWLVQSVGMHATLKEVQKSSQNGTVGIYYRVNISRNTEMIPTKVKRKQAIEVGNEQRSNLHFGFDVEKLCVDDYYGFEINGNNLFMLGDFTVTHNTSFASVICIHFLWCFYYAQIGATANTDTQLKEIFLKEFYWWKKRLPKEVQDQLEEQSDKVKIKGTKNWFLRARVAGKDNPEALAGLHGDYVLLFPDEACSDEQTEILTDSGFKLFKDLSQEDRVLSQDKQGKAHYVAIQHKHEYKGEREMYYYKTKGADFAVTSNHKMLYDLPRDRGQYNLKEISKIDQSGNVRFPRKIDFDLVPVDMFTVPQHKTERKLYPKLNFVMSDWVQLVAWYLSEGHIDNNNYVRITQKEDVNSIKVDEIKNLLERMEIRYTYQGGKDFCISYRQIAQELKQYGDSFINKQVPRYIIHSEWVNLFLTTFVKGDGYFRKNRRIFYSSSKNMMNDIQEMLYLSGSAGTLKTRPKEKAKWYKDHWIKSKHISYIINERLPNHIKYRGKDNVVIKKHRGTVYSVTTKYGNVFTRRNGLCMWTGNSGIWNKVFEVMQGALTGENWLVVMTSNPTRTEGYFYDSHKKGNKLYWTQLHFDSRESPIVKESFVNGIINDYGEGSDEFKIRVAGEFANEGEMDDKGWIPLFANVNILFEETGRQIIRGGVIGVDPAGQGKDRSIIAIRDEIYLKEVLNEQTSSEQDLARKVETVVVAYSSNLNDVGIDAFGIGAKVINHIHTKMGEMPNALLCDKPREETKDRFNSYKSELAWKFRAWVAGGGIIITNNEKDWLREMSLIKYKRDLSGRICLMNKQEFKKEHGFSPDRFDACCYTFFRDEPSRPHIITKEELESRDWAEFIDRVEGKQKNKLGDMSVI